MATELHRSFGLMGMVGFCFSIVTCWSALGGTLAVGIESGGPPVMVWSWVGVSLAALAIAVSFAEMCSAYPVAGGQYSWVAALAPARCARELSWICGWFMLVGIIANGAVNNSIAANFILGMANLRNPSYEIERWHVTVVAYAIILIMGLVNIFAPKLLDKLSISILIWNIVTFVTVIITLLVTKSRESPSFQNASFVFADFRNSTGLSPALGTLAGLLQSFYSMCCYDAPAHMTEELKNAARDAPKAIVTAVVLGAVTGFIFLVTVFFCVTDIASTANSPTGVPLIQIFYDSTQSVPGAIVLSTMIAVILLVCANSLMTEGSRSLYAFARDRGLPASRIVSKVNKRSGVPIYAVIICMIVQAALNTIYIGTPTGFNTVISIAGLGFYISYFMPLASRLASEVLKQPVNLNGPYNFGKLGVFCNTVGSVVLIAACVIFNFPSEAPINSQTMNYCPAAFGLVVLVSCVSWIMGGKKNFSMPTVREPTTALEVGSKPVAEFTATGVKCEETR